MLGLVSLGKRAALPPAVLGWEQPGGSLLMQMCSETGGRRPGCFLPPKHAVPAGCRLWQRDGGAPLVTLWLAVLAELTPQSPGSELP